MDTNSGTVEYRGAGGAIQDFGATDYFNLTFNSAAQTFTLGADLTLGAGGTLTLRPLVHFATEDDARATADQFVRAWQIDAGLQHGRDDFRLTFAGIQIQDRAAAVGTASLHSSSEQHIRGTAHLKVVHTTYSQPPASFKVTPEVNDLWERYNRYVERREPLLSMAYSSLTILVRGDRKDAVRRYNIQFAVLSKLGELTSERGDALRARKAVGAGTPLTGPETAWIEAALKAIIRHLAERRSAQLTMADLPTI